MLIEKERTKKLGELSKWAAFKIKKEIIIKEYVKAIRKMRRATNFMKHYQSREIYKMMHKVFLGAKQRHKLNMRA